MKRLNRKDLKRSVALFMAGAVSSAILITPAGAHIGNTVDHLWTQHIKAKVNKRVRAISYTKAQSRNMFSSNVDEDGIAQGAVPNTEETVASELVFAGNFVIHGKIEASGGAGTTIDCVLKEGTNTLASTDHTFSASDVDTDLYLLDAAVIERSTTGFGSKLVTIRCTDANTGAGFEGGRLVIQKVNNIT